MRNAIIQLPNSGCAQAVQPFGAGKLGMTIDEAADCTGIGRNTLRKLVSWGKNPRPADRAQDHHSRRCHQRLYGG